MNTWARLRLIEKRATHVVATVLACSVMVVAPACKSSDIDIGRIEVELDLAAQRTVQKNGIVVVAKNAIQRSPGMAFNEGRGGTLRIEVASAVPAQGSEDGRVRVSASVARPDGTTYRGTGEAFGQRPILGLAASAVDEAIADILNASSVSERPDAAVIAMVGNEDASTSARVQAVRLLASRKLKDGVPLLLPLLESPDSTLASAALSALGELRDPRAVDAIIAYAEGKPNHVRRACIDVIKGMPTLDGAAWLFTLSTGHADADVRASATAAFNAVAPAFANKPSPPSALAHGPGAKADEQRAD